MTATEIIRNKLIDKLFAINNKGYLDALYKIVEKSPAVADTVALSPAQITMLQMSEDDYKNGRTITQEQLDQEDEEWLAQK